MSTVQPSALALAVQPQGYSAAYHQLSNFAHQYDRGTGTLNGKPSFSVDQAATQLLRDGAAWKDLNKDGYINLTYSFLTKAPADFDREGAGHSRRTGNSFPSNRNAHAGQPLRPANILK